MSLFVIGDTHLSLSVNKPMDIFGGWKNYMQRLEENWRAIINKESSCKSSFDYTEKFRSLQIVNG